MIVFVIGKFKRHVAGVLERPGQLEYCLVCSVVTVTVLVTAIYVQSCVSVWYDLLTKMVTDFSAR